MSKVWGGRTKSFIVDAPMILTSWNASCITKISSIKDAMVTEKKRASISNQSAVMTCVEGSVQRDTDPGILADKAMISIRR